MYGVDIVSHWEVGYALYSDRNWFGAYLIEADIKSTDESPALPELRSCVDIISNSAVTQQWPREGQVEAANQLVAFFRLGTLVVGYQCGTVEAKHLIDYAFKLLQWRHDPVSFERM